MNPLNASQSTVCGLAWKRYSRQTPLRDVAPALNGRASQALCQRRLQIKYAGHRAGRPLLANLRRSSDMASQSKEHSGRRWWRLALLLFVVLPFVPEIIILAVTVIANAAGCE